MRRLAGISLNRIASFWLRVSLIGAVVGSAGSGSFAQSQVPFYSKTELARAVAVQQANQSAILAGQGVFGVGVGETNGTLAITVLVDSTNRAAQLPTTLDEFPVTVQAVGTVHALPCTGLNPQSAYPLPIPLGVSAGNILLFDSGACCASGTIGFKVRDNSSGRVGWISNNHVVGHGTDGCPSTAPIGTVQYQPGAVDNNCGAAQNIGVLNRTVPITFGGAANLVDCGFVQSSDSAISANILNLGSQVNNVVPAFVGQVVQKNGRTSNCTQGTVTAVNLTVNIDYSESAPCATSCGIATFNNQIMVAPSAPSSAFGAPGDSGSPIVDANNNAVGLLFAGDSSGNAFGNPIGTVLSALNVSLSSVASSQVVTRTSRFWFTHGFSSDANCATLLGAINFNGGVLDLGFVTLATANRNSDNVIDGTDAFIEALGFYWRGAGKTGEPSGTQSLGLKSSGLCVARKQLAVELIAAIANTTLLGTFPPNATYVNGHTVTNFPGDLISQARTAAAGFDVAAVRSMTALLKKFNSSGQTNNLPNGLEECSAQPSKILKPISRDPMLQDTCPGINDTCLAAKTIVFSDENPVFNDSVSLAGFHDDIPSPACNVGGRDAVWQVSPPVAANGRQFSVSTQGSNFDTVLSIWSGTCSNLTPVACADNVLGSGEQLTFTTDGVNTFFIVIEGSGGAFGNVKMSVRSF
ncbi:MAG TPA: hypothetical protein VNL17_00590 [Verrucomicrobiae bacterium]|nr:hypothetical protein [Verrucomicrobiae bacterium]